MVADCEWARKTERGSERDKNRDLNIEQVSFCYELLYFICESFACDRDESREME